MAKAPGGISLDSLISKKEIPEGKGCKHILEGGINKSNSCKNLSTRDYDYCSVHKKKFPQAKEETPAVVRDVNTAFIEFDRDSGTYRIDKTSLIANIKTVSSPISK
ncbi:hypothetical protein K502DRAFT_67293 [Neoconidiobolus thromboides FSU 785]|nr:hypothetical protein K502DRAFT_67293 [Neoconidiobolus thromboides FSU 785]